MKKKILLAASILVGISTASGVILALLGYHYNPEFIGRLEKATVILALGSMGLFFVGIATPSSVAVKPKLKV